MLIHSVKDWNTLVVGKVSPWIDTDSYDATERKNSEQVTAEHRHYLRSIKFTVNVKNMRSNVN